MPVIISDNKDAEKILRQISAILEEHGAYIDPDIETHCQNGEISVKSPNNKTARPLFRLPHDVLVPFDKFDTRIKKNRFVAKPVDKDLPKHQIRLMELMLELYNTTGQLERHRQNCPWILFRDNPGILSLLLQSREGDHIRSIEKHINANTDTQELAHHTFFPTRVIKCHLHKKFRRPETVLMPLVDCLNHHINGARYIDAYPEEGAFLSVAYKPIDNDDECYAAYRRLDALDSWLDYAFIDENAPFVRSIPLRIELGALGTILIQGLDGYVRPKDLPENLKDTAFYMPVIQMFDQEKRVNLSHIYIPGSAGFLSLRRILGYTIETLQPGLPPKDKAQYVIQAEKTVLEANHHYYMQLKQAADAINPQQKSAGLRHLIEVQLKKITNYADAVNRAQTQLQR